MIQRHLCEHPDAAADALHADRFTFEVLRTANFCRGHKITVEFIDQPGDIRQIQSRRHSAER